MPATKPSTRTTGDVLRLYRDGIRECFLTAADRAKALGISETAIRKWDKGELQFVKRASAERVAVVAGTCERLASYFTRRGDIGAYLLHETFEADRSMRPLDLVLRTGDPESAVDLFEATRAATADVLAGRLPPEAFAEEAWLNVFAPVSDDEQELEDELREHEERHDIPSAL
jgi:hypothetical protein